MIFWSGYGYIAAAISFLIFLATEFTVEAYYEDEAYYQREGWPILLAFLLCGAFCRILSVFIDRKTKREFVDLNTGETVIQRSSDHTMFFVPIRFWVYLMPTFGLGFYIYYITQNEA
jgi:hypothetical protein